MTTYTLTPRRHRVTAAKAGAAVLLAVATSGILLSVSVVLNLLAPPWTDASGRWDRASTLVVQVTIVGVVGVLAGVAFGLMLQNSPLAIVLYFALPIAVSIVAEIVTRLQDPLRWVDINLTLPALYQPGVTAAEWARVGASVLVWVVVPFVAGAVRTSRREVA